MEEYLYPIIVLVIIGVASGILLTITSKLLAVKVDETVDNITNALPGANCGACGYSGCEGYANAVAAGKADTNLCKPGGKEAALKISEIMGAEVGEFVREYAFIRCNGNCSATKDKYEYIGTKSCLAVEKFYNGKGTCQSGCLGLGDCSRVCEYNAISVENGVAVVNPSKCKACGKCVKACPNHLIVMRKETQNYIVRCYSADVGKVTRQVCKNGCIGCGLCVKKCPNDAIVINNNHAEIDSSKCTNCGACAAACPVKCISNVPSCQ